MNSEIGYGASAIKAGETRLQQAVVNLLKASAQKPEPGGASPSTVVLTPDHVGKNLDVHA